MEEDDFDITETSAKKLLSEKKKSLSSTLTFSGKSSFKLIELLRHTTLLNMLQEMGDDFVLNF